MNLYENASFTFKSDLFNREIGECLKIKLKGKVKMHIAMTHIDDHFGDQIDLLKE